MFVDTWPSHAHTFVFPKLLLQSWKCIIVLDVTVYLDLYIVFKKKKKRKLPH